MNVITPALTAELAAAVDRIAGDAGIKAAIITSGKPAFIAGADLMDIVNIYGSGVSGPGADARDQPLLGRRCASWRPAASRSRPPSTARRSAAAWSSAWPATSAC